MSRIVELVDYEYPTPELLHLRPHEVLDSLSDRLQPKFAEFVKCCRDFLPREVISHIGYFLLPGERCLILTNRPRVPTKQGDSLQLSRRMGEQQVVPDTDITKAFQFLYSYLRHPNLYDNKLFNNPLCTFEFDQGRTAAICAMCASDVAFPCCIMEKSVVNGQFTTGRSADVILGVVWNQDIESIGMKMMVAGTPYSIELNELSRDIGLTVIGYDSHDFTCHYKRSQKIRLMYNATYFPFIHNSIFYTPEWHVKFKTEGTNKKVEFLWGFLPIYLYNRYDKIQMPYEWPSG